MKIRKFLSYVTAIAMLGSYAGAMPVSADLEAPSILIDTGSLTAEGNNSDWYYADETQWHSEGITVKVNGEIIENPELTYSYNGVENVTPADVYALRNPEDETFDFIIDVTYTDENGNSATGLFDAKIGQRGDVNLDHKANVRDAAWIAKDLSQLYGSKKTTLEPFGIFLGNIDNIDGHGLKDNEYYGMYDLNVRDSAAIVNSLARECNISVVAEELAAVANAEPVKQGQTVSFSSAEGKPGETVTLTLDVQCNNNFESLDIIAAYDPAFTADFASGANGTAGSSAIFSDGKFSVVSYSSNAIADGTVVTVGFEIPEDMAPGEYPVEIFKVNTFAEFKGADCAEIVSVTNGSITVLHNVPESFELPEGETIELDKELADLTVVSADESIAKIEDNVLYGVSMGVTELTFTDAEGRIFTSKAVVQPSNYYEINAGEEKQLTISDNTAKLTWLTSNPSAATIENGLVKGISAGETVIYAINEAIHEIIYEGNITVNSDTPAVTTKPVEITPTRTVSIKEIDSEINVKDYIDSEMPDCSLYLANMIAKPGETISMPVRIKCNNNLESLDAVVNWEDTALTSSAAYSADEDNISVATTNDSGFCTVIAYSSDPISDKTVAYIDFTVPEDAVNGTVYNIDFSHVNTFTEWDVANDYNDIVPTFGGTITVEGIAEADPIEITAIEAIELTGESINDFTVISTDPSIASVNGNIIRGVSQGTTTLYMIDEEDTIVKVKLTVTKPTIPEVIEIAEGGTLDYSKAFPEYSIISNNEDIVSVKDNIINGVSVGTTEIYFMDAEGNSTTVTVKVTYPASFELAIGEEKDLSSVSSSEGIKWLSENPDVATVTDGIVKGISAGETVIYAVENGKNVYKGTVTVTGETAVTTAVTTDENSTTSTDVTTTVTGTTTEPTEGTTGDANNDGKINVRDCAFIAQALAKGEGNTLPSTADYSGDGKINVRDAAAIASALAKGEIKQ